LIAGLPNTRIAQTPFLDGAIRWMFDAWLEAEMRLDHETN
jgi:hypothetical protein